MTSHGSLRVLLFAAAAVLLPACGDDPTAPEERYEVRFEVARVDGVFVPHQESDGLPCPRLNTGGWIALHDDGTYAGQLPLWYDLCPNGVQAGYVQVSGSYAITGDSIRFQGSLPTGTFSRGRRLDASTVMLPRIELFVRGAAYELIADRPLRE